MDNLDNLDMDNLDNFDMDNLEFRIFITHAVAHGDLTKKHTRERPPEGRHPKPSETKGLR